MLLKSEGLLWGPLQDCSHQLQIIKTFKLYLSVWGSFVPGRSYVCLTDNVKGFRASLSFLLILTLPVRCIYVWVFYLYFCVRHVCSTQEGQKRALHPLGPELHMVVSCHADARK